MRVRKLAPAEHGRTRKLYESVFYQDEARFVDYYYSCKTPDNVIYVAEDEGGIHAMLHLNPYQIDWNGELDTIHYIVAVATEQKYRHRGLMRRLIGRSLLELYEQRAPYVFLMPASEAIYTPFGFRRAWEWRWEEEEVLGSDFPVREEVTVLESSHRGDAGQEVILRAADLSQRESARGKEKRDWEEEGGGRHLQENALQWAYQWRPAEECSRQQLQELSSHVNKVLGARFRMFVHRSTEYYRNLDREQRACGGQLEIFFSADGNPGNSPDPSQEKEGMQGGEREEIAREAIPLSARCTAKETFPPMMTRIIHLESFIRHLKTEEEETFYWQVKDELIPGNNGLFEIKLSAAGGEVRRLPEQECELGKIRNKKRIEEIDIADIPELLGKANPFLHTMICEVV